MRLEINPGRDGVVVTGWEPPRVVGAVGELQGGRCAGVVRDDDAREVGNNVWVPAPTIPHTSSSA